MRVEGVTVDGVEVRVQYDAYHRVPTRVWVGDDEAIVTGVNVYRGPPGVIIKTALGTVRLPESFRPHPLAYLDGNPVCGSMLDAWAWGVVLIKRAKVLAAKMRRVEWLERGELLPGAATGYGLWQINSLGG